MLAKRKKQRFKESPRTEYPRHRKFVRQHECIVPGCAANRATFIPIEACHVRLNLPPETPEWARGGISRKPHDAFCFSGCSVHHAEQHRIGEQSFARKYGVNPLKEALDLARHSPCPEVREFVKGLKV